MNVMQSALRQMHEERFDRPEDEREDGQPSWPPQFWNSGDPSTEPSTPPSENAGGAGDNGLGDDMGQTESAGFSEPEFGDPGLIAHADREASRRKGDRPEGRRPSAGLHSFIDKQNRRTSLAAGPEPEHPGEPTDEMLFLRYQQGDEHAFFSIYERYKSSIYAYCAHVLFTAGLSRELVEDTFQDVFMRLVQYRHTFTGGEFKPWIFTVTRHSCLSAKKQSFRRHDGMEYAGDGVNFDTDIPDDVRQAFSQSDDPLELMSKAEQTNLLLAAIAKLPDEFREALMLSEYEELSYEEIGRITGTSLSTARIRIFRAKARLRKMLMPVLGDDAGMQEPEPPDTKKI